MTAINSGHRSLLALYGLPLRMIFARGFECRLAGGLFNKPYFRSDCWLTAIGPASAGCCARCQPFRLKKTNALKMERISHEENPEAHAGSKMGFG